MIYIALCLVSGVVGGLIGRAKGSSFFLWLVISAVAPIIGPLAALLYRSERDELRRQCPTCGRVVPIYDALCTRCGTELDFPEVAVAPASSTPEQST
jgi:hypothetical protein